MRNGSLLSSILVAFVAWALPGSVYATPPPLEAPPQGEASPPALVEAALVEAAPKQRSINGWEVLIERGRKGKADHESCQLTVSGTIELVTRECGKLFAIKPGTTNSFTFSIDGADTSVVLDWPSKRGCISEGQQPCVSIDPDRDYIMWKDGQWEPVATNGQSVPDRVREAVIEAASPDDVYVLAWVDGELTRLEVAEADAKGCNDPSYAPKSPEPSDSEKRKARNKAVRESWHYVVCIDASNPNDIEPHRKTTVDGADFDFVDRGNHLFEGRKVEVRVWHRADQEVNIDLDGEEGTTNHIYDATTTDGFVEDTHKWTSQSFPGRRTDQTVQLSVTVTSADSKAVIATHEETYGVTAVYRAAIRFGLVGLVSPFAREYSDRAATDAANNPGKVITVDGGGRSPLLHSELVTAMSVFFTPVYQGETTVTGGAMFGLGILATGGKEGFNALTSVHFGLELDVGRDFAIAAIVALRRTDVLKDGYFVGRAVADDEQYTRFGVRPSFGLMLTWSPAFTQAFGKARKVK